MQETPFYPAAEAPPNGPGKTRCPVRLNLTDGRTVDAEIFLLSDAVRPGGVTTVEGTLDGERDFIPVSLNGASALLSREAVRTVEMATDAPGAGDQPDVGGTFDVVNLRLDSGEVLSGVLRTLAPVEAMRTSDIFNRHGRFLTLSTGDRLILVAKKHLVHASF
jgi:hypothetical protein